ncbi:hypothetical protein SAMN04488038_104139 [Solimonas aquatica]|uniref:MetA-pathway of phenol degradation n=1 Tax=Solimonas aquatica TaxID=489703 RepID=A0A1H9DRP2_9GAMM|nr:hypothetical protein [Solimonas aquatica]SEQ16071.1 hypothetical protein SAMN04488038_104139 [Solimonas aquatica]
MTEKKAASHPTSRRLPGGVLLLALCPLAQAGPPFRTDDPEPVDDGHIEAYLFTEATHVRDNTDGTLLGAELNYGAAPDLQLSITLPLAFDLSDDPQWHTRYGATELGAKYRFVHEQEDGWLPQISFYPAVEIPQNDQGPASTFLPLWAQKSIGRCDVFGGGGYRINPGRDRRNNQFFGIGTLCAVTPTLGLGTELYTETPDSHEGKTGTGMSLALHQDFSERWHLVASLGRGLRNAGDTNLVSYYVGLEWTR